nr:unnamed protein product [Naegleria fowleri]
MSSPSYVLSSEAQHQIFSEWNLPSSCSVNVIKQSENHTYLIQVLPCVTQENNNTINSESTSLQKIYILRLTPKHHRSMQAIQAELDFIQRIHDASQVLWETSLDHHSLPSLHVCPPIQRCKQALSSDKNDDMYSSPLIATLHSPYQNNTTDHGDNKEQANENSSSKSDDSSIYYAVLFEYARGSSVLEKWIGLTNESFIDALGRAIGEMHRIVASYDQQSSKEWKLMAENIPLWYDTHNGACKIERIRERANQYGHEPSRILLNLWENLKDFLAQLKPSHDTFGVIHGDINVSNYFAEKTSEQEHAQVWIFDFDQVQRNYFGCDLAVVLQMVRFFEDDGLGIGKIEGFDADRFRGVFLQAYKETCPRGMIEEGHLDPNHLKYFEMFREFYHTSVAVDILFRHEHPQDDHTTSGQPLVHFEESIISFCKLAVNRLKNKFNL